MNTKKITLFALSLTVLTGVYLSSCNKSSATKDSDTESAENNALAEANYNDVTTLVDQAALTGDVIVGIAGGNSGNFTDGSLGSSCASITVDTVSVPHVITIDFGTSNCLCKDARYRRGKIVASFTGRYRDAGTVISVTFNNYFVNDNQISGTKTVTNQGVNNLGHPIYSVQVNGQMIKANNAGTVTWTSARTREWVAGFDTPVWTDDVYSITGTASGTNASGKSYTITITEPLIRKMDCRWFESGKMDIKPDGEPTRTLDYGNTGCDANATVTILGYTFPIVLH
jgi:hypothetical protein